MKIDLYTKIVLSFIAVALCALAVQELTDPAIALGNAYSCGSLGDPCTININVRVSGFLQ